jgi:protein-L-isoaspartate(D-aspartate) O-methyltransferase
MMGDLALAEFLKRQGIRDERVLEAIARLNRADFVPEFTRYAATQDSPLPIGYGQTISQPYIVALMSEGLKLKGHERVLEIGTGSGYQTAVLGLLCREVYSVEIVPELARSSRRLMRRLGYPNVYLRYGDGSLGWPEMAPFDAIIGTAAPVAVPPKLLAQLKAGGRMVIPVGRQNGGQDLLRITRGPQGQLPRVENLLPVRFVPMTGEAQHVE